MDEQCRSNKQELQTRIGMVLEDAKCVSKDHFSTRCAGRGVPCPKYGTGRQWSGNTATLEQDVHRVSHDPSEAFCNFEISKGSGPL